MSHSFYRAAMEAKQKKNNPQLKNDKDEEQRNADRKMMRDMGPDHKPGSPYRTEDY